jgi:hypothetical protein
MNNSINNIKYGVYIIWLSWGVETACSSNDSTWNELLSTMTHNCNEALRQRYKNNSAATDNNNNNDNSEGASNRRFAQLSSVEQAAIIESQFFEVKKEPVQLFILINTHFSCFLRRSYNSYGPLRCRSSLITLIIASMKRCCRL